MGVVTNASMRVVSVAVLSMPWGGALGDRREAIFDGGAFSVESVLLQSRAQVAEAHANVLAARGYTVWREDAYCHFYGRKFTLSHSYRNKQESLDACAAYARRVAQCGLSFQYCATNKVCDCIPRGVYDPADDPKGLYKPEVVDSSGHYTLYSLLDNETILAECRDDAAYWRDHIWADAEAKCSPHATPEEQETCMIHECAKGLHTRNRCYDAVQAYST